MSRLIDADALRELFAETISAIAKRPEMDGNLEYMIRSSAMAIKMIDDQPTADAVPAVHGHWGEAQRDGCITYDKNAYRQCSVCGNRQFLGMQMNYCPQCGAKMDEVTE